MKTNFRTLEDNLEGVKAKLSEYEASLESMERGDVEERLSDLTRKIALLRSNEAIMVRRCQVSILATNLNGGCSKKLDRFTIGK